jgi:PleD family two-component response regulator
VHGLGHHGCILFRRDISTPALGQGHADSKPRVLLADDDAGLLESVSTMLAADFDVAALATDGEQAVQAALDVDPACAQHWAVSHAARF